MRKIGPLIVILIFVVLAFSVGRQKIEKQSTASNSQKPQFPLSIWERYSKIHDHNDHWWCYAGPSPANSLWVEMAANERLVKEAIQKYATVNRQTSEIRGAFQSLFFTIVKNSRQLRPPGTTQQQYDSAELVFCFIPASEIPVNLPISSPLFFDGQQIYIYGIIWPEKLLPALLFHELSHALKQKQGLHSPTNVIGSDEHKLEEVEMQAFGLEILKVTTDQVFQRQIDAILDREKPTSLPEALRSINYNDLVDLDRIIGCETAGRGVATITSALYLFGIGIRYIGRSKLDHENQQLSRITLIDEIDKIFSTQKN